ncbi:hypothetical protein [Nocardia ninae]|uniref:hypothetical protein n=1 Tax=Nocardia ninae TaxID=356145 RepID=UPI0011BF0AA2|nr:hypothetical protein [Nocardia ninae]
MDDDASRPVRWLADRVKAGYGGVVLGCEPTEHRWKPLLDHARGVSLIRESDTLPGTGCTWMPDFREERTVS